MEKTRVKSGYFFQSYVDVIHSGKLYHSIIYDE